MKSLTVIAIVATVGGAIALAVALVAGVDYTTLRWIAGIYLVSSVIVIRYYQEELGQ